MLPKSEAAVPLSFRKEFEALKGEIERLRETEAHTLKMQQMVTLISENVGDLLAVIDPKGFRIWNNPAYFTTLGYDPSALEGTYSLDEVHPEDKPKVTGTFEESMRTGMGQKLEYRVKHRNGHWVLLESMARVVTDKDGEVECLVLVARDITQRRHMEEERSKSRQIASVASFASGVAHELDGILKTLRTHLGDAIHLLPGDFEPAPQLGRADEAAGKLQQLVHYLMNMGDGLAEPKNTVAPGLLLREETFASVPSSMTRCILSIEEGLPDLEVEEQAIRTAFKAVFANALEHDPSGRKIQVSVRLTAFDAHSLSRPPQLQAGGYVLFEIQDHGSGADAEVADKVFEPYFSTKEGSQGMGLTSALAVVSRHGGTILFRSTPGEGSTVQIFLPVQAGGTAVKPRLLEGPAEEPLSEDEVPMYPRVLFMDDEPLVREFVVPMLQRMGYETVAATTGEETLELYAKAREAGNPFHVVIVDLMVPDGMGGKEAVVELRKINPKAKVVVSSGHIEDEAMLDPKPLGFSAVIAKPYNARRLKEVLESVLRQKA
jgi:PAS domain S-box-containing protein